MLTTEKVEVYFLKKTIYTLIIALLLFGLVGCSEDNDAISKEITSDTVDNGDEKSVETELSSETEETIEEEKPVIKIFTNDMDLSIMIQEFISSNPDFSHEIKIIDLYNIDFSYEEVLYDALSNDLNAHRKYDRITDYEFPDIFTLDNSRNMIFTPEVIYQYAATYKELGIDTDALIEEASIPQYYVEAGSNLDGDIIGLGYQNTAGAFIYRRSIAKEVWGTDDPSDVASIIGPGWDERWLDSVTGNSEEDNLGYFDGFGLVDYMMSIREGESLGEGTYGDWAVCNPPSGFFMGGDLVFASKKTEHKEAVGEIIEWITLDTSETGFQYQASESQHMGYPENKFLPASMKLSGKLDGTFDFLGGQDPYEVYTSAATLPRGDNLSNYNYMIGESWKEQALEYAKGKKTREEAIVDFKQD